MKIYQFLLFLLCAVPQTGLAAGLPACPAAGDADRARLASYVKNKYKLPESAKLRITELSFVGETCYRKLQFVSAGNPRPFKLELIASPDLRFLTRDLFDSEVDPVEEERQNTRAAAAKLAQGDSASLGPKDAPVTMVIFSDFQCPFCSQMANGLVKEILPSEGKNVRVIFRNFPLDMHPWARPAAEAIACARIQNESYFWPLHDYVFAHQRELTAENLLLKLSEQTATLGGFDPDRFKVCVDRKETANEVNRDIALGSEMKVEGTPTLFINGQRVVGYRAEEIQTLIREQIPAEGAAKH